MSYLDLSDKGSPEDTDPVWTLSEWAYQVSSWMTTRSYWDWVYEQRWKAQDECSEEQQRSLNPEDVLRAAKLLREMKSTLARINAEVFAEGVVVYWYRESRGKDYKQMGEITRVGSMSDPSHRIVEVENCKTGRKTWLSLYDLRWWLNETHPKQEN